MGSRREIRLDKSRNDSVEVNVNLIELKGDQWLFFAVITTGHFLRQLLANECS